MNGWAEKIVSSLMALGRMTVTRCIQSNHLEMYNSLFAA
jgi:hypothetical protein